MSSTAHRGTFRIVSGAHTANLVVETAGAGAAPVQDVHALTLEKAQALGFQEGYETAMAEAARRQAQMEQTLAHLTSSLPRAWEDELAILEDSLRSVAIDLAFEVAECLLRQPANSEQVVRGVVSEALALPLLEGDVELRCNPGDAEALQSAPPTNTRGRLRIVPDPGLQPGDACLSTGENGDLEAHLAYRLAVLKGRLERLACAGPAPESPQGHGVLP